MSEKFKERLKKVFFGSGALTLVLFLLSVWTPGEISGRLAGTAGVFLGLTVATGFIIGANFMAENL